MKWWNKWTRKRGGWVERTRQFEKMLAETFLEGSAQKAPVVAGTDSPAIRVTSNRDGK